MLKINKVVIISFLIFTQLPLWAQNNTNSPYTRFGYGELADRSFGAGRAMGGVGYGLRSSKQINPLNPASYSCINIKVDPQWRDFWREAYAAVIPGYHQNKEHWNTVILDGSIPDEEIRRMIAESYDLICGKK